MKHWYFDFVKDFQNDLRSFDLHEQGRYFVSDSENFAHDRNLGPSCFTKSFHVDFAYQVPYYFDAGFLLVTSFTIKHQDAFVELLKYYGAVKHPLQTVTDFKFQHSHFEGFNGYFFWGSESDHFGVALRRTHLLKLLLKMMVYFLNDCFQSKYSIFWIILS